MSIDFFSAAAVSPLDEAAFALWSHLQKEAGRPEPDRKEFNSLPASRRQQYRDAAQQAVAAWERAMIFKKGRLD